MKSIYFIIFMIVCTCCACGNQKLSNDASAVEATYVESTAQTYAEISIKEGGYWKEREYIGGTFKNVDNLSVPPEHADHSWFIRYEGPGWESSRVGYRLYLDWRNAIDIFGKTTDEMILSQVGQDGFDSYHEMGSWGMDILKAGKSLGLGSVGRLRGDAVIHMQEVDSTTAQIVNTSKASSVHINRYGWSVDNEKIDLHGVLSITPDARHTKHTINTSKGVDGLCTGIVKYKDLPMLQKISDDGQWGYIATYGKQTLLAEPDNLGMAILYEVSRVENIRDSAHDHLVVFKPTTTPIHYYFLGAWEQEKDGIKTEADFLVYLDDLLRQLEEKGSI